MEILKNLISENGPALIDKLQGAGFSIGQANDFLPNFGNAVSAAISSGNLDVSNLNSLPDLNAILNCLDIDSLATRTGIDTQNVTDGISQIWPLLSQTIQKAMPNVKSLFNNNQDENVNSAIGNITKSFLN